MRTALATWCGEASVAQDSIAAYERFHRRQLQPPPGGRYERTRRGLCRLRLTDDRFEVVWIVLIEHVQGWG